MELLGLAELADLLGERVERATCQATCRPPTGSGSAPRLEDERTAALAEAERHRAHAEALEREVEALDADAELRLRLAELKRAVAGEVTSARGPGGRPGGADRDVRAGRDHQRGGNARRPAVPEARGDPVATG